MVWYSIIVIIIGTSISVQVDAWSCGQVRTCIVFVCYPVVIIIVQTSVSVCIIVWRCGHIRTRIVNVHDAITVIVQVVVHIPLHTFHDECKSDRISVQASESFGTARLNIPSDDIDVKVR